MVLDAGADIPPPVELLFIEKQRILCSSIKQDFESLDPNMLLALASKNQVVYYVNEGT